MTLIPLFSLSLATVSPPGTAPGDLAALDIRGIKDPIVISGAANLLWWLLALLLLAAFAWIAWRYWWHKKTPPAQNLTPQIPPHVKARQKLEQALACLEEPRPFCILVSDAIRVYLEEQFQLHAPERTTEEFLDEVQSSPALTFDQKQALGDFLSRCDLVKFARYLPGKPELNDLYQSATRLIDETEPAPPPPDPVAAPASSLQRSAP
jgi:hypothetical protein